jgi:hypothetical protein
MGKNFTISKIIIMDIYMSQKQYVMINIILFLHPGNELI